MCIICESDFENLNTVKTIDRNGCPNIREIPKLDNLVELKIEKCLYIIPYWYYIPIFQQSIIAC